VVAPTALPRLDLREIRACPGPGGTNRAWPVVPARLDPSLKLQKERKNSART